MNKTDKLVLDCYRELFKRSEPSVNFDDLLKEAKVNEFGQKEIPFMEYEIDEKVFYEILKKYSNKMVSYKRNLFENTILLGCSPRFIK
jgi:hypothetical protein